MPPVDLSAHDEPLRTITWALLAVFVVSAPIVVGMATKALARPTEHRKMVLTALVFGVLARLLVPGRLVMHYMGYELLEQARALGVTPKYGPASFQWQHALMQLGEPAHQVVIAGHRVMGIMLVPLAAGWSLRLGASRRAVSWALLCLVSTPLLIRDAATESLLVEATTWAIGSAWLLAGWWRTGRNVELALAGCWGLLAMLARPEMLATVPLLWLATSALIGRKQGVSVGVAGFVLGVIGAVLVLRGQQLLAALAVEQARGNTPRVFQGGHVAWIGQLLKDAWWDKNSLLWPTIMPGATVFSIGLGAVLAEGMARRRLLVLAGLVVAWLAPTALDLPFVSVPRVQAPVVVLASVAAGVGLSVAHGALHAVWRGASMRLAGSVVGGVWIATALVTIPGLRWQGPAHVEEAVMQQAAAALAPGNGWGDGAKKPLIIVARSHDDPPDERVHLAMPRHGFGAKTRVVRAKDLRPADVAAGRVVHAWLGTRCFMRPCDQQGEHPACARLRERYELTAVVQRVVTVTGPPIPGAFGRQQPRFAGQVADLDFPWCFAQRTFTIGLYRLGPKRVAAK